MKSAFFLGLALILLASMGVGCGPAVIVPLTPTPVFVPSRVATPAPTRAPLSYVAKTYQDDANGFELDYPIDWTLVVSPGGSRSSLIQLFSPGATSDNLPGPATRLSLTVFSWDPKNDLAAFIIQKKIAWEAGGFSIMLATQGDLLDGRRQMSFMVQDPVKADLFFLFTTFGDKYLQITGEGNLGLAEEIAKTIRAVDSMQ